MRILILANGPFAKPTLRALATSEHDVVAVIVRPPQAPPGRRAKPGPIQLEAENLTCEVWSPETANSDDVRRRIVAAKVDLLVVCDYGEILRPDLLSAARRGAINLHGSLLPKYRGAAPVQWAILRGETETGNSVIQLTPGLDSGPILAQERMPIHPEETAGELETRLAEAGATLVHNVVNRLAAGSLDAIEQDDARATRAPRLHKQDGLIDWTLPAEQIQRTVRAMQPWPKPFTQWERPGGVPLRLILQRVSVIPGEGPPIVRAGDAGDVVVVGKQQGDCNVSPGDRPPPGMVLEAGPRLVIEAGKGAIRIDVIQPAGRKAMAAEEFLRGYPMQPGQQFGAPAGPT